jgi:hypothetical protein
MARKSRFAVCAAAVTVLIGASSCGVVGQQSGAFQEDFNLTQCALSPTGRNDYFILEPGFQLVLEGGNERLHVTVLEETRVVGGVTTRVVEEREWVDGELYEIARNYFAICPQTKDVFYFGEDVDFYKGGKVTGHSGSWLAGSNGARAGLIMPGTPSVGMRYYQEIAPGVAMDRAEVISVVETARTPAGNFTGVLKTRESTALDDDEIEHKLYAPGIGLIRDQEMILTKYGFISRN